jgi:radical SAM protein (TIGR04043 family)
VAAPTGGTTLSTRVDIAIRGVRLRGDSDSQAPVRRRSGAGPSDDGHVLLGGLSAALPLSQDSPYTIENGRLLFDGADAGMSVEPVHRPAFYDLKTADGVVYEQLARLHGRDVLASTVVQTCTRYGEDTRCRFCAIEASLAAGSTTAVKTPAQLAEVAEAAVRLDGIKQMVLTTGTTQGRDRGARHLARCVRAIKARVPSLPIQVQCEPPAPEDLQALQELRDAGTDAIGIHVESLDDAVRRRWMPGKAEVPLSQYWLAWHEAVRLFGHNRVSTYLLVGLGEDPDELVAATQELIDAGVYPFVVPFRPLAGTLATDVDRVPAPAAELLENVTTRVAAMLRSAGMSGAAQTAGCAACGACSALSSAGG